MDTEGGCIVPGCDGRWAVLLPSNVMSYKTAELLLGYDGEEIARLCSRHYRAIRNREGFIVGYRYDYQAKRLRRYIREWIM